MSQKYGDRANLTNGARESSVCLICDTDNPRYSWTDLNGEGYCTRCGSCYQLANGTLAEGEKYPRANFRDEAIPLFRRFWKEHQMLNPTGSIIIWRDYPEKAASIPTWEAFVERVKPEYPELFTTQAK